MLRLFACSRRVGGVSIIAVTALTLLFAESAVVKAQSGTRRPAPQSSTRGSTTRGANVQSRVALEGYCPVCIIEMKKWVPGKPEHQAIYDGKTYHFPGPDQQAMFVADPAKYVPALGGDCTVCSVNMGKRSPGNIRFAAMSGGRLFLFPNKELQQEFLANSTRYADADLAFDGNCSVCRIEMGKDVPGKPEIAAYHQGLRYLFPSEKQREMFAANPAKYAVKAAENRQSSTTTRGEQLVSITGKSGCAGCDHGVVPIGSPSELGLAVNVADGNVYVIEDAHKLYPDVYERRFEGLSLEVAGKAVKRDGKITWIQPAQLKNVN